MAATKDELPDLIGISEASRMLELSAMRVRQLIAEGRLEIRWTPYGKLITPDSLERELQRRKHV